MKGMYRSRSEPVVLATGCRAKATDGYLPVYDDLKGGLELWADTLRTYRSNNFKANILLAMTFDLPDSVPDVKGYTGWDHMQCNMDAGK
ncbi:hypothetical protein FJMB80067_26310 [Enterobacter hormaechei]|uniref:hypothetical protein n=1 Tax=Enterobacter hormaechei TaxID=158836 RepID=UPI002044DDC3|nr:hypothetical protein [Enterobacter hormaechei]BDJ91428.1 hypothetical protein FJMB80067_26310 [Enterobacter hormaechei]